MSRTAMIAAFAAALAASPMALAADTAATTSTTAPAHTSVSATQMQPDQIRATDMKGSDVYDTQNKKVGSIKDMIIDKDGKVAAVVIDADGKNVAVPMNEIKVAMDENNKPKFSIDKTQDQLKSAQAFELNENKASGSSTAPSSTAPAAPPAKTK